MEPPGWEDPRGGPLRDPLPDPQDPTSWDPRGQVPQGRTLGSSLDPLQDPSRDPLSTPDPPVRRGPTPSRRPDPFRGRRRPPFPCPPWAGLRPLRGPLAVNPLPPPPVQVSPFS